MEGVGIVRIQSSANHCYDSANGVAVSDIFYDVYMRDGLIVPGILAGLSDEKLAGIVNGCGPGSQKVDLVPDSILGIDFFPACLIHDAMYHFGVDREDKGQADRMFLFNLITLVDKHCKRDGILNRMQRVACREAAFIYYKAVANWGLTAFWSGKFQPRGEA